ncbi:hypothetical protein ACFE04_027869 [Oxalis oulophora]
MSDHESNNEAHQHFCLVQGCLFYKGIRILITEPSPCNFSMLKAVVKEFPALERQSVFLESLNLATSVLKALAKMVSSMLVAKRVVKIDTMPALALQNEESEKLVDGVDKSDLKAALDHKQKLYWSYEVCWNICITSHDNLCSDGEREEQNQDSEQRMRKLTEDLEAKSINSLIWFMKIELTAACHEFTTTRLYWKNNLAN